MFSGKSLVGLYVVPVTDSLLTTSIPPEVVPIDTRVIAATHRDLEKMVAENNFRDDQGLYDGRLVRRSSFNPDYENMLESIFAFVDRL